MAATSGRVSRAWTLGLILGALACLALLVLPTDSVGWVLIARGGGVVTVVVFGLAVMRIPRGTRQVWWAIWGYAALTVAADLVYDVQERLLDEAPFPGPADVLYLAAYAGALTGLLLLIRRAHPGRDRDAWIDTMILTIAATAAIGVLIVSPSLSDASADPVATAVSLAYPLLDILLLSGLIRLVVGRGRTSLSVSLLIAAFGMTLAADLAYDILVSDGVDESVVARLDALFLAAIVTMTAAALAPGADRIDVPVTSSSSGSPSGSLIGLALGALTIPCILVLFAWREDQLAVRLLSMGSVVVILLIVWRLHRQMRTVQEQAVLLAEQARTDSLTGLPNRRTLDHELDRAAQAAGQTGAPLTAAMLDLDRFKEFNDRHGHPAGDAVLVACAEAWRRTLPRGAFLARYGGEEFALLIPGLDDDGVRRLLEEIRACTPAGQTVSIGYARVEPDESGFDGLLRADRALYEAKAAGRNRVVAAGP